MLVNAKVPQLWVAHQFCNNRMLFRIDASGLEVDCCGPVSLKETHGTKSRIQTKYEVMDHVGYEDVELGLVEHVRQLRGCFLERFGQKLFECVLEIIE